MLDELRRPKERPAQWGSIMRKEAKEAVTTTTAPTYCTSFAIAVPCFILLAPLTLSCLLSLQAPVATAETARGRDLDKLPSLCQPRTAKPFTPLVS